MDIDKSARLSFGARLDKTNPKGIHIGEESFIAKSVVILAHDFYRSIHADTYIGKRCFIGVNAIIMPGIRGNNVIVGSGAVVAKNIPNNCIIAGNPAKIIKENIQTVRFGN